MKKISLMCAAVVAISFSQLGASNTEIFENEVNTKTSLSSISLSEYANFGFYQSYRKKFEETKNEKDLTTALFYLIKGTQEQIALLQSTINSSDSHKIEETKIQLSKNLAQFTTGLLTQEEIEEYLNYKKK